MYINVENQRFLLNLYNESFFQYSPDNKIGKTFSKGSWEMITRLLYSNLEIPNSSKVLKSKDFDFSLDFLRTFDSPIKSDIVEYFKLNSTKEYHGALSKINKKYKDMYIIRDAIKLGISNFYPSLIQYFGLNGFLNEDDSYFSLMIEIVRQYNFLKNFPINFPSKKIDSIKTQQYENTRLLLKMWICYTFGKCSNYTKNIVIFEGAKIISQLSKNPYMLDIDEVYTNKEDINKKYLYFIEKEYNLEINKINIQNLSFTGVKRFMYTEDNLLKTSGYKFID